MYTYRNEINFIRHLTESIVSLFLVVGFIGACSAPVAQSTPTRPQPTAAIANPASESCVKQGGTLSIRKRGDGGEYGVCVFEDNEQCEEWAMIRGECPTGGIGIAGYVTAAAQYCAFTGGEYSVTDSSNTGQEQGTCALKNGKTCDVWEYYNGKCGPTE